MNEREAQQKLVDAMNNPLKINWQSPVSHYPKQRYRNVAIVKKPHPTSKIYYAEGVKGHLFVEFEKPGNVMTALKIGKRVWMVDYPWFCWCLEHFAAESTGKVLVAGLGLGIVVHYLAKNPKVERITVVDNNVEVLALIALLTPNDERLEFVYSDFYRFMENDRERRDTVIWDLAQGDTLDRDFIGKEGLLSMPLRTKYKYGDIKLFRHGVDRDPVGAKFVEENIELIRAAKKFFGREGP